MTAISIAYAHHDGTFVIAADGRCASGNEPERIAIKTDTEQKLFLAANQYMHMAYAISGLAMIGERSFETIVEAKTQIDALAKRKFIDGHQFADKVSFNMTKVVGKAIETERIPANLGLDRLPAEERGRLFKLYLCGYYKGLPLLRVDRFYHNQETHNIIVRSQDFDLSQSQIVFTGSDKIAAMIYGDETIDREFPARVRDAV
jgi:hypothetical protein